MDQKLRTYEDDSFEEERQPDNGSNIQKHLIEFCRSTKMYGFSYLGQRITLAEKLYWVSFIFLAFFFSASTVIDLVTNWNRSQVTILRHNSRPVWDIPFPAITICPETQVRQSVYNFTDYYHRVSEDDVTPEELQTFSTTSLFCDTHLHVSGNKTEDAETVMERLQEVSPPFGKVLFSCRWSSYNESCSTLFKPLVTDSGMCFTFNMLERQEIFTDQAFFTDMDDGRPSEGWSLENGYQNNFIENTFPRRTPTSGSSGGFFLLLTASQDDWDYVCRGPVEGFKVLLHQPTDIPNIETHFVRLPLNQEIVMAVEPTLETTSEALRSVDPQKRGCFFSDERKLKFFKKYSQRNCMSECLANFTASRCGCVNFYMPHEKETQICGSGSNKCAFEAGHECLIREAESDSASNSESSGSCNCLPACTSLSYGVETSQADFHWLKVLHSFKSDPNEFPGIHMTRFTVFFKNMRFSTTERNVDNDGTRFLAHCGGLLAFFCGFSFLTIAELIYFLTLKIVCNIKRFGGNLWGGRRKPDMGF